MNIATPCGVVANVQDDDIIVSGFEFHFCYYFHFRTNTVGKGMKSLIPQRWLR